MTNSEYEGRNVLYIDPLKLTHTGVIVGQSEDGQWQYVQSDRANVSPNAWHFKVRTDTLPALLQ